MKKGITFVITSALLITLLAGCKGSGDFMSSSEKNKPIINEPYKLYLENNQWKDYSTERLGYPVIDDNCFKALDDIPDKTVTLFGKNHTFEYFETQQSTVSLHEKVIYWKRYDKVNDTYFATFDAVTGSLRAYSYVLAGENRTYQSDVNEKSSETEFLSYAKNWFLSIALLKDVR